MISLDTRSTKYVDRATISSPVAYGPHDLSALHSDIPNPWSTLSCHHHCHYHPQPPHDLSAPSSATQTPWNSNHHCHCCFYLLHPPPHFDPLPNSTPVHHPQGIAPMKPIVCTTCPICHNAPPAPVQLVETTHHPQEMRTPNRHLPRSLPLPTHPMFTIQCHCGTTLLVQQEQGPFWGAPAFGQQFP